MKKFLRILGLVPASIPILDIVQTLIETQEKELYNLKKAGNGQYTLNDNCIDIAYFPDGTFEAITIYFGYTLGRGLQLVLSNYVEHTVIINHEIQEVHHVILTNVPPEGMATSEYRKRFDEFAERLIAQVKLVDSTQ